MPLRLPALCRPHLPGSLPLAEIPLEGRPSLEAHFAWAWQVPGWATIAASILVLFRFTAEDAYIVARYAETLVLQGVLHYNSGEPVNALTSPLHALVEAALYALTRDTVVAYKLVGVGCLVLVGLGVTRALRPHAFAQGAALLVAAAPCVALWSVGGLETPLLMAAVLALALLSSRAPSRRDVLLASALAAVCVLARYDAVLFAAPVTLGIWIRRGCVREAAAGALIGTVFVGGWMAYALATYGDILPTSFYVKTPSMGGTTLNALYVGQYLVLTGAAPMFVAAVLLGRRRWGGGGDGTMWLWSGLALIGIYALTSATTHMMFGFRLGVPYLPVIALLAGRSISRRASPVPRGRLARAVVLVALAGGQLMQLGWVATTSVNGSIWSPADARALATAERYNGTAYEYTRVGAWSYADGFMEALEASAGDIRADWQSRGVMPQRPLRLHTFAAGIAPYALDGSHVFEALVSHRRGCSYPFSLALSADYVHVLTPGHGPVGLHLPAPEFTDYRLVSDRTFRFNGQVEHLMVYRNQTPLPNPLPPRVHDACPQAATDAVARVRSFGAG